MTISRGRLALGTVAVTLFLAASGSAALAYWRAGGSGTGAGLTGTTTALSLSTGTAAPGLYPGTSVTVSITVTNPNTAPVRISSLALDTTQGTGGFAVDAGHGGCALSALSFATQTNAGAGWNVPAKVGSTNGSLAISLPTSLALATTAANACQGATFTAYLKAAS